MFPQKYSCSNFLVPQKEKLLFHTGLQATAIKRRILQKTLRIKKQHAEILLLSVVEISNLGLCVKEIQWKF